MKGFDDPIECLRAQPHDGVVGLGRGGIQTEGIPPDPKIEQTLNPLIENGAVAEEHGLTSGIDVLLQGLCDLHEPRVHEGLAIAA